MNWAAGLPVCIETYMANIKRNFFYNSLLTVANYLFPLIVYPYVSRVLGVTNIGICNYVDSIVHWFILFSMMGMSTLGNREMAAAGADRARRSKAFSELIVLNLVTTLLAALMLVVAMYAIPALAVYRSLLWVGVVKLMANFLCIEWFYVGTENFRYITTRSILVKTLYVAAVFVFVRKAEDYPLYYLLSVLMIAVNALINIVYSRKTVSFSLKGITPLRYLKPFLMLGLYMLLTSMYVTLNVTYLGAVSSPEQVGYYSTASKLYGIVISFFSAFTGVMMPRMSSLLSENREEEFRQMIGKTFNILLTFAIPLVIYATVLAPEIVRIFAGEGYEGAYIPARIIMPLILVVGLEQVFVIQILMPGRQDKAVFINSCAGALIGVGLNILLVSRLLAVGTAIAWLSAELTVLVFAIYFSSRKMQVSFPWQLFLRLVAVYLPALAGILLLYLLIPAFWWRLGAITLFTGVYTGVYVLFIQKNEIVWSLIPFWKR